MKKIISLLLAFILALCPIAAMSTTNVPSPTLDKVLFRSQPRITYMIPAVDDFWFSLDLQKFLKPEFDWQMNDVIIIKTIDNYSEFICQFAAQYKQDQHVAIVLTNLSYQVKHALNGEILENGSVKFNFEKVNPNTYIMFVFAADDKQV